MKRIFLAVIVIVLTGNAFGQLGRPVQRYCGSQPDFEEMQRTDPEQYQRFMDYEGLLRSRNFPLSCYVEMPVIPNGAKRNEESLV